jgi:hypothetical protein
MKTQKSKLEINLLKQVQQKVKDRIKKDYRNINLSSFFRQRGRL